MADLYVCPTCAETEDCACSDLSKARRNLRNAESEVCRALGWLTIRLVQQMPDVCAACAGRTAGPLCALCKAVESAKKTIAEALPKRSTP